MERTVCCSNVEFARDGTGDIREGTCIDHDFAVLEATKDTAIEISGYDGYPLEDLTNFRTIANGYYLSGDFQAQSIVEKACQLCSPYKYQSSCGPLHNMDIPEVVVTLGSTTKSVAEWRLRGKNRHRHRKWDGAAGGCLSLLHAL